ncbi:MAG: T9SS type A sorting domain-containing protein, partial [Ignavibacteriaceae bacterium]|nr:T9SS type A sorting domain-containing protein [Ignavibacteriaceae bacterium]
SSNGFVSFVDITDAAMSNGAIPSSNIPNNFIAGIWDDLDGKTTGKVYYKQEPNRFIVQYDNWPGYSSGTGPFTWQFVIHKNGKVMLYYKTITGTSTSATVGIENHNGTDGLQVVYNAAYLQNNLALQFSAEPEWLLAENIEGTVYNGNSIAVLLNFLTEGLDSGDYSMDMVISSNDPLTPDIIVPIAMKITSIVPVEFSLFTLENINDEVVLKWQTATETNNRGFEIERSQKLNIKSQSDWANISFVEGRGTSTEKTDYIFRDKIAEPGIYIYRLKQIDFDGTVSYSSEAEVEVISPKEFALYQNYPNPFNPSTTIKFALPEKTNIELSVYNSLGEKVADVLSSELSEGYHEVEFSASNLSSGIYFYRLESGNFVSVKKMIIIK